MTGDKPRTHSPQARAHHRLRLLPGWLAAIWGERLEEAARRLRGARLPFDPPSGVGRGQALSGQCGGHQPGGVRRKPGDVQRDSEVRQVAAKNTDRERLRDWLVEWAKGEPRSSQHQRGDVAMGFGPEAHLDESDPNHNT